MEKEIAIPLIQFYIKTTALQRIAKIVLNKVKKELAKVFKGIWKTLIKSQ